MACSPVLRFGHRAGERADVATVANFSKWLVATLGSSAGTGISNPLMSYACNDKYDGVSL
jgi:hypothetical protein